MPYQSASAVEIDRKIREDFKRRLKEYGVSAEVTDPVLAVLFRTFAQQLEVLYKDTDKIRLALLDELIDGLGIGGRRARPAQTIIRMHGATQPVLVEAGTPMSGEVQTGGKFTFATDASVWVSPARVACAFAYEDKMLRLLSSVELPDDVAAARPSLDPVKANLGPMPALFIAVDLPERSHLSGHSIFFDITPDARSVQEALAEEAWCLAGDNGEFGAAGILRPKAGNAGLRELEWLVSEANRKSEDYDPEEEVPVLPPGFYAGKLYKLPVIPVSRQFSCAVPRALFAPLEQIFSTQARDVFKRKRAWFKISFPAGLPALETAIGGISLNAMSASNVECFNQTIKFAEHGTAIPISKEGGTRWHFVAPLSVLGENDTPYLMETEPAANPLAGRYAFRNGRIELVPARFADGRPQTYANVRVWITSGTAANAVGPGRVSAISAKGAAALLRVTNPTAAAGGTDEESLAVAQDRFSSALLSRDRIVTRADLYANVKAFDRRVREATIRSGLERVAGGLRRVEKVTVHLDESDFHDPELEGRYLSDELAALLRKRVLNDVAVSVTVAWRSE
jgi:hypothetical protein